MTGLRRSKDASVTYWLARGDWCSKRESTAQKCRIGRASRPCWSRRRIASLSAPLTCGWTPLCTSRDKGASWVERTLGWSAEIVRHPPKPVLEEVGERVGRRGDCHGPKEVAVRGGPKAILAKALGGEADLLLVGLEQEAEPRDYERPP